MKTSFHIERATEFQAIHVFVMSLISKGLPDKCLSGILMYTLIFLFGY